MKLEFRPLAADLLPACAAFNRRLRASTDAYFTLPEFLDPPPAGAVHSAHWLAVDDSGAVRGGVLLQQQRGWIAGQEIPLTNIQSPITEGVFDRRYAGVAIQMLKFLETRAPYAYAVGMGSAENPFARLLKAAGWTIATVPFFFSIERGGRFLSELPTLQHGPKRLASAFLARTGLAAAGAAAWRLAHFRSVRGAALAPATHWDDRALDSIWQKCRPDLAFSAARDAAGVRGLHPESQARLLRFQFTEAANPCGWSVALLTQMNESAHFGSLRVATILDALVHPAHRLRDILALTRRALNRAGADLVVTNQMHTSWAQPLRRAGFLPGPSNYMLATSKSIGRALSGNYTRAYVTRADGDGRIHL